jgi:hypothetical protein
MKGCCSLLQGQGAIYTQAFGLLVPAAVAPRRSHPTQQGVSPAKRLLGMRWWRSSLPNKNHHPTPAQPYSTHVAVLTSCTSRRAPPIRHQAICTNTAWDPCLLACPNRLSLAFKGTPHCTACPDNRLLLHGGVAPQSQSRGIRILQSLLSRTVGHFICKSFGAFRCTTREVRRFSIKVVCAS